MELNLYSEKVKLKTLHDNIFTAYEKGMNGNTVTIHIELAMLEVYKSQLKSKIGIFPDEDIRTDLDLVETFIADLQNRLLILRAK